MTDDKRNLAELFAALAAIDGDNLGVRGNWPGDCEIDGLRLVCTCNACPEQYDVFDAAGKQVGYLRLRHGFFRVDVPTACDETIYEAEPEGDGVFKDHERAKYLCEAVKAIKEWLAKQKEAGNDQA